ncbi:chemotaxis protein CheW [Deltaproteobacteria bacterium TL4]
MTGNEVEVDKTILEMLADPLIHIIRNCCDHGIESSETRKQKGKASSGTIEVYAYHEAGHIIIKVVDDGKGIDTEVIKSKALERGLKSEAELAQMNEKDLFALLMLPGFSTAQQLSDVSGRGVGMDVVKTSIESFNGTTEIDSTPGVGTSLRLSLPLTLAIIPCLIVSVGDYRYAIPQVNLVELVRLYDEDVYKRIECAANQEVYRLRNHLLPMVRLKEVLSHPHVFSEKDIAEVTERYQKQAKESAESHKKQSLIFAVLKVGSKRFGLILDNVIGTEEIVVKPMHQVVKKLDIYSGATVMGDGKVALILDIDGIAKHSQIQDVSGLEHESQEKEKNKSQDETQTVLLFKSGEQEQFAVSLPLIRRIERIPVSRIEKIGNREFVTIDGVSTRILRIHEHLNVSPCPPQDIMLLLLPKHIKRPVGILISSVIDVVEINALLNDKTYMEDGLLGTALVKEKMTLFMDIYRFIEKAEPDWFLERKRKTPSPVEQKSILLVEDTVFFRHLVKGYLEADGYLVETAENGKKALEMLQFNKFDLIVSDIQMPVMNGWEFMTAIRADEEFKDIPALALTALDNDSDRERAFEVGFNAYERKIEREQLLASIARLLQPKILKSA